MAVEALKGLLSVTERDERNLYFVVTDEKGHALCPTLERLHHEVASIALHDGVPEIIRSHFAQAQNLALYSWFYYPFNVTAQFMGFVSLEYALQIRTKSHKSFSSLLRIAVKEGWVADERFSIARIRESDAPKRYVDVLVETIPKLRNRLAHGSNMLHNSGISSLLICAEFINQLFPEPAHV